MSVFATQPCLENTVIGYHRSQPWVASSYGYTKFHNLAYVVRKAGRKKCCFHFCFAFQRMSSQTKGFVGADMQLPTPHECSQLQLRRDPAAPDEIDHTSRIENMFKDENVTDLENALKVQRQASNPNYNPRRWLSMIDRIHLVQIRSAS